MSKRGRMRMVMIGLTLIGAASAAWEGQGNAPTVRLDPSLWDSLKPGQYKRLDNDVVVARTTRGVFFGAPPPPRQKLTAQARTGMTRLSTKSKRP